MFGLIWFCSGTKDGMKSKINYALPEKESQLLLPTFLCHSICNFAPKLSIKFSIFPQNSLKCKELVNFLSPCLKYFAKLKKVLCPAPVISFKSKPKKFNSQVTPLPHNWYGR